MEIQTWDKFDAVDTFNNNKLVGRICREHGDTYGSLYIEQVNSRKAEQLIYCVPKLHYPFDKNDNWHFPKALKIERYEKLDGTSIFQYRYTDSNNRSYITYKTRLLPVLGNSRFGPFLDMWQEILRLNPDIATLPDKLNMNLAYELWGARNPHLIKYEVPLVASLLFARSVNGLLPPSLIAQNIARTADFRGLVNTEYIEAYKSVQSEINATLRENDDKTISGSEGEVWYLQDEFKNWSLIKCKPELIEAIHFSSGGIPKNTIWSTCENALENWDDPTVENIYQLLLEEFTADKVEKAFYSIKAILEEVKVNHVIVENVMYEYKKQGLNVLTERNDTMRGLSKILDKDSMRKAYAIIVSHIST